METILGIKGQDFVMLAADCTQAHSIISLKEGIINKYSNKPMTFKKVQYNLTLHLCIGRYIALFRSRQNSSHFR